MAAVIASAWTLLSEAVFGEPRRTVPFEVTGPEHGVIPIEAVEIPHFPAGDPAAYDYLEENGYVVISGVLDDEEVEHAKVIFCFFYPRLSSWFLNRLINPNQSPPIPLPPGPLLGLFGRPRI